MRNHLPLLIRAAAIAAVAGSLLLPAAGWKEAMSAAELATEAALVALAFLWTPRAHWSWKLTAAALFAGDLLFTLQCRLNITAEWLFLAEGLSFTAYAAAAAVYLAQPDKKETAPEPLEKFFLLLVTAACTFISLRYVVLPYIQSGNHAGVLNYSFAVLFRIVQAAAIAQAIAISLKTQSAYWMLLSQGILLLSLTSIALGYTEGVTLGQNATFHEYGWLWGLLLLALAQTWPAAAAGAWSRWDSIRVRLAWIIFIFNAALIGLLYSLKILLVQNAYHATSLLYTVYALWVVSNFIALQVSLNVQKLLDSIQGGPAGRPPAPSLLNIHEIGLFAGRLREAYARIEQQSSMAAIGQTTAMLAHDVRKPFAMTKALIGSLGALKEDPGALERARGAIEKALAHVDAMLADIMDFSRAVMPDLRPESLRSILDYSVRQTAHSHPGAGIKLEYDLRHGRKPLADSARLVRAVSNVLGNAAEAITVIGSRSSGTIRIASRAAAADGQEFIELTLANDGPPVAEGDLPHLFESFFTKGKARGTGLGLASARKIIELHGGSVKARNLPGGAGVEFVLLLPASGEAEPAGAWPLPAALGDAARPDQLEAGAGQPPAAGPGAGRRVVLACDDDELTRKCITLEFRRLEAGGAETGVFPGAEELLAFLREDARQGRPARYTVFTDQNMGGMSGLELAAEIKALGLPACRVYLVSNEAGPEFGPRALKAGADGCFKGPLDAAILSGVPG